MSAREWLRRVVLGATAGPLRTFDAPLKPIDQMFVDLRRGTTGRVGRDEALSVPAVLRGRNLLCSIATLPLVQRDPLDVVTRNALLEQIDPNVANVVTMAQTVEDLVFDAVSWWQVTGFGFDMFPMTARHLDVASVSIDPPPGARRPLPSGLDPAGPGVYVHGVWTPAAQIIRFDSPNPAVLKAGARAIRRAILLDQAARLYSADPRPLDYFTAAVNADAMDDDEIAEFLAEWEATRRARSTGYVPPSVTYNTVAAPTAADMQLVALQERASLEIANAFGLDPEELGVSTTSRTYANVQDRRQDKINDVLAPYMRAITDRLSMPDVTRRGYRVEFELADYLKSNPTERWAVHKTAKEIGVMDPAEIRRVERIPGPPPKPAPAPEPAPAADPTAVDARRAPVRTFDAPTGALGFVRAPVEGFTADTATRTIAGTALPYNRIGEKFGLRFRFERGALEWSDPARVKLLRDHDYAQALGRAVDLKDGPSGLAVRFSVARGDEGDRALALAEDGVLDGLSVGIEFDMATDTVPDPRNKGVVLVRRATLREVSLTAMPAFDDARVTKVAASRTGGMMETCATCGTALVPGVAHACAPDPAPAGLTLSAAQITNLLGVPGVAAALLGQPVSLPMGPPPVPELPAVVDPTAGPATVTEPAPYRFDRKGNLRPGAFDFSTDLHAFHGGDAAAGARATEFVRAQFDIVTTDVNELNPVPTRPDMYVDQRDFRYPVWDAINKGNLATITPFIFPKYSSSSGLVGAHTEGTEPTSGTLVTTSQTVTPTAISGKAKISREAWDQGGNPAVSNLIWRQMQKAWYEALEAAAVAVLDAASPTQIDFSASPGLADDDLDQALTQEFAALQFIRGGFSMDTGFAQIDLYKALIGATDSTGRRLFPAIGAMNATGTVARRWAAVDVNGVQFLPAWALAATGSVAASSYLFDRDVVHGWASSPNRMDFQIEVANVYIGLWGYKATAISDLAGVREIVYDPA